MFLFCGLYPGDPERGYYKDAEQAGGIRVNVIILKIFSRAGEAYTIMVGEETRDMSSQQAWHFLRFQEQNDGEHDAIRVRSILDLHRRVMRVVKG